MVPESPEISTIHSVAQLQVDDPEDSNCSAASSNPGYFLLLNARIHSEENVQCIKRQKNPKNHLPNM